MTTAELILSKFRGRSDYVAVCDNGRTFHPAELKSQMQPTWLESEHLSGKRCLGFYVLESDNTCWLTAVDFDNHDDHPDPDWQRKTEQVYYELSRAGLSPVVEMSQSGKAAHVWLFFDEPTEAWIPRAFWRGLSLQLEIVMSETYPRQDVLKEGGLGNLIRYPLWNQSRFVDVENEWATIEPAEALACKSVGGAELRLLAFNLGMGELKPDARGSTVSDDNGLSQRVTERLQHTSSLLSRRWNGDMSGMNDASNSALVQSIACELVRTYVPTIEIENAIRVWCKLNGYEKGEREQWISDTVRKAYDFVLNRNEKKSISAGTMKDAAIEYLDKLATKQQLHVSSGIDALDRSIDGVGFGEMCVIAARPAHGKSAFAMQWVDIAAAGGMPCLVLSEEMSRLELGHRAVTSIVSEDEKHWRDVISHLKNQITQHYEYRKDVHVVESVHTIDRAEEIIDQYCSVYGVRVVVVDYLQLLSSRGTSRYETVTDVSQRLKKAAVRNECALLALCQLNRGIEDDKRKWKPKMSDLRESGQIEQDADLILFLVWQLKCDPNADPNDYTIFCGKRRNGAIRSAVVFTKFFPERQSFGPHPNAEACENYETDFSDFQ